MVDMYLAHYNLKKNPFALTSDKDAFFKDSNQGKLLERILKALASRLTLGHVTGLDGAGKTTLCQLLYENLYQSHPVILLSDPCATLETIARQIMFVLDEDADEYAYHDEDDDHDGQRHIQKLDECIHTLIADRVKEGRYLLLIIDDAEQVEEKVLMHLLHLALDVRSKGKIKFVLAGQLAMGKHREQYNAIRAEAQLKQFNYTLQALHPQETSQYLAFRLAAAGIPEGKGEHVFSREAVYKIHDITHGNLARINRVAEEGLRNAYKDKSSEVLPGHIKNPSRLRISRGSNARGWRANFRILLWKTIFFPFIFTLSAVALIYAIPQISLFPKSLESSKAPEQASTQVSSADVHAPKDTDTGVAPKPSRIVINPVEEFDSGLDPETVSLGASSVPQEQEDINPAKDPDQESANRPHAPLLHITAEKIKKKHNSLPEKDE